MKQNKLLQQTEQNIQRTILDWLALKHIAHFRLNTGAVIAEYKGKTRFFRSAPVGAPDVICCINGKMVCLELKRPRKQLTEAQVAFHKEWSKAGAVCVVAHSLEEAIVNLSPMMKI